jgi:hypothetical protein
VVAADLDGDGWTDLYVASDSTIQALYRNRGDGTFEDVSLHSGTGYSQEGRAQAGMGVDAGDYDGDGRLDLFVTTFQDDYKTLYHNDGNLRFSDVTYAAKIGQVSFNRLSWGTGFQDFDNDGGWTCSWPAATSIRRWTPRACRRRPTASRTRCCATSATAPSPTSRPARGPA